MPASDSSLCKVLQSRRVGVAQHARCAHGPVVRARSTSAGANAYVANEEDIFCSDQK